MAMKSSYLRFLPPVLWEHEPDETGFSLGSLLSIFEKVLTGIDDGFPVQHGDHTHDPIHGQIDRLYQLFDPWRTPPESLSWLASWVALDLPTLQGQPIWDEYQQRKVISDIAKIYRQRGLRSGLNRYLSLYAVGETRPRVAVDDGARLLFTQPLPGRVAPVTSFVAQGPVLNGNQVLAEGLIRPWCIAPAPDGGFFVGDTAVPGTVPVPLKNRVWHISAAGQYDLAGAPPHPQPLAADTLPLTRVVALAVRPRLGNQPEALYVIDRSGIVYRIPAPYTGAASVEVVRLAAGNTTMWPVAMAIDGNGDLLVLDRGDGSGTPNPPKIITVSLQAQPPVVSRRNLKQVIEPLALLVQPTGQLLIGDGREQDPQTPDQFSGNIVLVDRSNAANWTETPILAAGNPLVAPTAITRDDETHVYVLDAGVKPFTPPADPFVLAVAEPATVYRVDLGASPPSAARAVENGQFVFPTGMAASGGRLVICDPGQPEVAGLIPVWSRLLPYRFGVVVHFTNSRLPADPGERANVQRQVVGNIRDIVDEQKPAHALWALITAI